MPEPEDVKERATWLARKERGNSLGIRFFVFVCTMFGRAPTRLVLRLVMAYFFVVSHDVRQASRDFLARARNRPATLLDVYRHLYSFGCVTLDRIFFLRGEHARFHVEAHGSETLDALSRQKSGALLLGAHLGSFEVMRVRSEGRGHDLHVLAYLENSRRISDALAVLAPDMANRIIELGGIDALIRAKEVVDRGGMLAMLGDRTGLSDRTTEVDFFGEKAPFPLGPFLLAAALKCPVLLVFGLYRGGNRYEVYCEPFADRIVLPRGRREEAAAEYAQQYAQRLEHYARSCPESWFNLYDFWRPGTQSET